MKKRTYEEGCQNPAKSFRLSQLTMLVRIVVAHLFGARNSVGTVERLLLATPAIGLIHRSDFSFAECEDIIFS